ncbi:MAG: hypothetical protein REI09_07715 [Candidatus Dactylopiibacterium sp.]|nr:hypothetical protein [Candidatus Dactylopiibacterium sp.]
MYIVALAWLFVACLLSAGQTSLIAAFLTFFFWGVLPLALVLWIVGTPRRRRRLAREAERDDPPPP